MNMPVVIIAVGAAAILIVVALIVGGLAASSRRRTALIEIAARHGFAFTERDDRFAQALSAFPLCNRGSARRARNVLVAGEQDAEHWIFDYQYTIQAGKHAHTHRQTVFSFPYLPIGLPSFELRPENVFHKIGAVFGYQDLDFADHPGFSSKYLLRATEAAAVRTLFDSELILAFDDALGQVSVEGGGSCLLFYQHRRVVRPDQILATLEQYTRLRDAFLKSAPRPV